MRNQAALKLAVLTLPLISIFTTTSTANAAAGVLLESTNDTVVKIKYLGSSTDNAPILSVTGGKNYGAIIEGTWRGLTGRVPGHTMPFPGTSSGIAAAGPIGIAAYGTGSGSHVIGGHYMTTSNNPYGTNYGLEVNAMGGYQPMGIYATASYGTYKNWAAFFVGNTYATGMYQNSDRMFKKNIVDYTEGLSQVMKLKPKAYDMKTDEFKNHVVLPGGRQVGLIAQELELVLPDLVTDVQAPAQLTPEERASGVKKDALQFKAVNYTGLIPVVIAALQEQQALIVVLQAEVEMLKRNK